MIVRFSDPAHRCLRVELTVYYAGHLDLVRCECHDLHTHAILRASLGIPDSKRSENASCHELYYNHIIFTMAIIQRHLEKVESVIQNRMK